MGNKILTYLIVFIIIIAVLALDFLICAGIVKLLSWAFEFTFSWKLTFGIWITEIAVANILRGIFKINRED